jgi:hypothetical protein
MTTQVQKYSPSQNAVVRSERQGVKLRDAQAPDIAKMLLEVCVITGMPSRNIPEDTPRFPEATYLFKLIREVLGEWTTAEVVYAFKMAATRQINAPLNLYDRTISIDYLGTVMDSYRAYKKENKPVVYNDVVLPEPSEQEKQKIMRDGFIICFERYHSTGMLMDMGGVNYRYAEANGLLMNIDKQQTHAKAKILYTHALKDKMLQTSSTYQRSLLKESMRDIDPNANDYKRIYQEIALKSFFTALAHEGKGRKYLINILE